MATLALAGDTMLGRNVGEALIADPAMPLVTGELVEHIRAADAFVLNLECCISDRGVRFPDPAKPFFFRAPPLAAERLADLGVDAVTLANNHALDYGPEALLDTLTHLQAAGVSAVGAGADERSARTPLSLSCGDLCLRLVALSDHPPEFAAGPERPGIAFAEMDSHLPAWMSAAMRPTPDIDLVLVLAHWGPNMAAEPVPRVRRAAGALLRAGADLIAGHSAHVFHGVAPRVMFDLGDFIDDYAADAQLRNDLGLLWLVELGPGGPGLIRAVPLWLQYCFTAPATPAQTEWIVHRLRDSCAPFGTDVELYDGMIELRRRPVP